MGRPEHDYFDPENNWKTRKKIDFKMNQVTDKGDGAVTKYHGNTPGGTATGDEEFYGYGEIIEGPNGSKMYITPTGDDVTPDGESKFLQDIPIDMILDNYGMEVYMKEYKRRFGRKPNMGIFKNSVYNDAMNEGGRDTNFLVPGCRRTESLAKIGNSIIKDGSKDLDRIKDISQYQSIQEEMKEGKFKLTNPYRG